MSDLERIEKKLLWLADIEEIKQLKARYAAACDDDYDAKTIADLFVDEGVWDGGPMGFAETRAGIREFFEGVSGLVGFVVHGISNPLITVDGDSATGRWYLHQPMTFKQSGACYWLCAQYFDDYVRTADGWKFRRLTLKARAFSPYEKGFGQLLMAELPS